MGLETFFTLYWRIFFLTEAQLFTSARCASHSQFPPIHCKARRDSITFKSPKNRAKIQESLLDKLSHNHHREYTCLLHKYRVSIFQFTGRVRISDKTGAVTHL